MQIIYCSLFITVLSLHHGEIYPIELTVLFFANGFPLNSTILLSLTHSTFRWKAYGLRMLIDSHQQAASAISGLEGHPCHTIYPLEHWLSQGRTPSEQRKKKKTSRFQPQMFGKYPMTDIHKPPGSLPKKQFLANYDYWWLLYFQKLFYIYQTNIIQTYPSQLHPVPTKALFMFYDFHDMSITLPSRLGSSKIAPNSLQPP